MPFNLQSQKQNNFIIKLILQHWNTLDIPAVLSVCVIIFFPQRELPVGVASEQQYQSHYSLCLINKNLSLLWMHSCMTFSTVTLLLNGLEVALQGLSVVIVIWQSPILPSLLMQWKHLNSLSSGSGRCSLISLFLVLIWHISLMKKKIGV